MDTLMYPHVRKLADRTLVLFQGPKRQQLAKERIFEAMERQSASNMGIEGWGSRDAGPGNMVITRHKKVKGNASDDWSKLGDPLDDGEIDVTYREGWPFPTHYGIDEKIGCVLIAAAINDYAAECPDGFDPRHECVGPTELGGPLGAFCIYRAGVEKIKPLDEKTMWDVVAAAEVVIGSWESKGVNYDEVEGDGEKDIIPTSIEQIERETPKLGTNSEDWLKANSNQMRSEASVASLKAMRSALTKGAMKTFDKLFGIDKTGRRWRKTTAKSTTVYYWRETLKGKHSSVIEKAKR